MKKLVSLWVAVIMGMVMLAATSVVANDEQSTPLISVGSVVCNGGNTIAVPVYIENNPGITSVNLKIGYDSRYFILKKVEDKGLIGEATHSDDYMANPYTLSWENDLANEDITNSGKIVNLVFEVRENTPAGRYSFLIKESEQLDCKGNIVHFAKINGAAEVKEAVVGDANSDGVLDTKDRMHISRYVADWKDYREINLEASDVNSDGKVNSKDRMYVSRYLASWKGYEQFYSQSVNNTENIITMNGVIVGSSDEVLTSANVAPYVDVCVTYVKPNKFGIGPIDGGCRKMFVGKSDALNLVGRECQIYALYDELEDSLTIIDINQIKKESLVIDIADIIDMTSTEIKYYVNEDKTATASISADSNWFYNGFAGSERWANLKNMSGTIELLLLNNATTDADYDTVYVTAYDVFVVDSVSATSKVVRAKFAPELAPNRIKYDESDGDVKATLYDAQGNKMAWEDLKEYDVLSVKYVRTAVKAIYEAKVIENVVTGTITGISGIKGGDDRYIEIDGTEYKVARKAEVEKEIKLGDEGTYYLDDSNIVVYHRGIIEKNKNYAMVIGVSPATSYENAKAKILTKDSNIVTLEFASKITVGYRGVKTNNVNVVDCNDMFVGLPKTVITYKVNAAGQISAIEIPSVGEKSDEYFTMPYQNVSLRDYDEDSNSFKLDGLKHYLSENTVVFYVYGEDIEEYEVVVLNNLSDGDTLDMVDIYDVDEDRVMGAIVINSQEVFLPSVENATFITKITYGNSFVRVSGYKGFEEVTYTCEEGLEPTIGSLVVPVYKANGDVNAFLAITDSSIMDVEKGIYGEASVLAPYMDDGEMFSPVNSKNGYIVIDGYEYEISDSACAYVYHTETGKMDLTTPYIIDVDNNYNLVLTGNPYYKISRATAYLYFYDDEVVDILYVIDGYQDVPVGPGVVVPDVEYPEWDIEINLASIYSNSSTQVKYYDEFGAIKTANISETADLYVNGVHSINWAYPVEIGKFIGNVGSLKLAKSEGSSVYDKIYLDYAEVVEVSNITDGVVYFKTYGRFNRMVYEESEYFEAYLADANGDTIGWDEISKGDVLSVQVAEKYNKTIYKATLLENCISGVVTGVSGTTGSIERTVEVDGISFKVIPYAEFEKKIKIDDEGTYYLDNNDNIIYHKVIKEKNKNYAMVIAVSPATAFENAKAKILTKDSNIVTLEFADEITVGYKGEKENIKVSDYNDMLVGLPKTVITYKVNADGQISAIEIPSVGEKSDEYFTMPYQNASLDAYDEDSNSFRLNYGVKHYLSENTVVFYAYGTDIEKYEVVVLNNLSDGDKLEHVDIYDVDEDRVMGAIVIKSQEAFLPSVENATFVVKTAITTDEDGYDVCRVTGYVAGEEVTYVCDADNAPALGSLVVPVYAANGDVEEFESVTAVYDAEEGIYGKKGVLAKYVDDGEYFSPINSAKNFIVLEGCEYEVAANANVYVYDNTKTTRVKHVVDAGLDYVEFVVEKDTGATELYIDGEEAAAGTTVTAYLYFVDDEVVDVIYLIDR